MKFFAPLSYKKAGDPSFLHRFQRHAELVGQGGDDGVDGGLDLGPGKRLFVGRESEAERNRLAVFPVVEVGKRHGLQVLARDLPRGFLDRGEVERPDGCRRTGAARRASFYIKRRESAGNRCFFAARVV